MYEIEADSAENVLYVDITGQMEREEIDEAATEAIEAANHLAEGFHVITDLRGFAPPSPEEAEPIKRAQKKMKEMGVDRVIRVADEDTSQVVIAAFDRRSRDVGYSGETADSVSKAEEMLDAATVTGYASQ